LSEQARRQLEKTSTKFEDLNLGERRPTQLIRRYGNLYSEGRLDALDALDDVAEMMQFNDLKGKLLLTILVVSSVLSLCSLPLFCPSPFLMRVWGITHGKILELGEFQNILYININ